jgi:C4-dicarboxylate-specific signal transduction histidine kinase
MDKASQTDLEQRLRQVEGALERCQRIALASCFAGAVMHEVNNPLEAITNLVYLTKTRKDDPALVSENMGIIEQQLAVLSKVTTQALTFHRTHAEAQDWDLVAIAESALKLHADKITQHGVTVDSRLQRPAVTLAFGTEILQVVSNLILNALDALPRENGRLSFRVRTHGKAIHITLSDNGSGMPAHVAGRLFEPYITTKTQGTGLGLWLSQRIIVKHGGTLRFRTSQKPGRTGTTFRVTLPLTSVSRTESAKVTA